MIKCINDLDNQNDKLSEYFIQYPVIVKFNRILAPNFLNLDPENIDEEYYEPPKEFYE